eukprot:gene23248-biopygen7271
MRSLAKLGAVTMNTFPGFSLKKESVKASRPRQPEESHGTLLGRRSRSRSFFSRGGSGKLWPLFREHRGKDEKRRRALPKPRSKRATASSNTSILPHQGVFLVRCTACNIPPLPGACTPEGEMACPASGPRPLPLLPEGNESGRGPGADRTQSGKDAHRLYRERGARPRYRTPSIK